MSALNGTLTDVIRAGLRFQGGYAGNTFLPFHSSPGFAESIIHASAHVEAGSVFCPFVGEVYLTVTEADGKRSGYKQEANLVSPGFFDVFGLEVTEGEREALSKPNQLAIPESLAKKMFGEESPVGKPIRMESKSSYFLPLTDWQVGAVYKDLSGNTQLGNNILAPMPASFLETFGNSNFICYLRLDDPGHASSWRMSLTGRLISPVIRI